MIHLKRFNEGVSNLYWRVSEIDFNHARRINFDSRTKNLIDTFSKKEYKVKIADTEVSYPFKIKFDNSLDPNGMPLRKSPNRVKISKNMLSKSYVIIQDSDNYYYILYRLHWDAKYYKCDGIDGLEEFIKNEIVNEY